MAGAIPPPRRSPVNVGALSVRHASADAAARAASGAPPSRRALTRAGRLHGEDNHWYDGFKEADWCGSFGFRKADVTTIPPVIASAA